MRDRIQLVHAPIGLCRVGSYFGFCYAWDPGRDDQRFDLALIDGPRARTYGRFMTLPLLWRHLSPGSLVLVDDARRSSLEGVWLQDWSRMFDGSLRWQTDLTYAKGLALLMKTDDSKAPKERLATDRQVYDALGRKSRTPLQVPARPTCRVSIDD